MAYFSNGTEGMDYEERYCSRCVHRNGPKGDSGCHVWLAHLLHASQCVSQNTSVAKDVLNLLIPEREYEWKIGDKTGIGHTPDKCAMFHEGEPVAAPDERVAVSVMPAMREWAQQRGISV